MNNKIYNLLVDKGAIMQGHFVLTSGLHSNKYIEKFRVLEDPNSLEIICREMAVKFDKIDINDLNDFEAQIAYRLIDEGYLQEQPVLNKYDSILYHELVYCPS